MNNEHDIGSIYFTFNVSDNPNNKYPGTWILLDSNTYLISAGNGINAKQSIGNNQRSIDIDWLHTHAQNAHKHSLYVKAPPAPAGGITVPASVHVNNTFPVDWNTSQITNQNVMNSMNDITATNQNSGTMSKTQTFDNRPNSTAIYMWERVS